MYTRILYQVYQGQLNPTINHLLSLKVGSLLRVVDDVQLQQGWFSLDVIKNNRTQSQFEAPLKLKGSRKVRK